MNNPTEMRSGDYAKRFPRDTPENRAAARDVMRRQGCKSIRFELYGTVNTDPEGRQIEDQMLIAHGYVGRFEGPHVEDL